MAIKIADKDIHDVKRGGYISNFKEIVTEKENLTQRTKPIENVQWCKEESNQNIQGSLENGERIVKKESKK